MYFDIKIRKIENKLHQLCYYWKKTVSNILYWLFIKQHKIGRKKHFKSRKDATD